MDFELVRIGIAVALTGVAAYQDAKTSYIDDKILYAMVAIGALLDVFFLPMKDWPFVLTGAAAIAVIGFVAYKRGSFGQGDVWLFLGLQLLLPFYPSFARVSLPNFPFVASVFLAASFLSVLGSTLLYGKMLFERRLFERNQSILFAGVCLLVAIVLALLPLVPFSAKAVFFLFIVSGVFLAVFYSRIREKILITPLKPEEIEDEDVLAIEKMKPELVKKYGVERVLTQKQISVLKKIREREGVAKFPVFKHLPRFGPYVLLGLIACVYAGDLLVFLLFF